MQPSARLLPCASGAISTVQPIAREMIRITISLWELLLADWRDTSQRTTQGRAAAQGISGLTGGVRALAHKCHMDSTEHGTQPESVVQVEASCVEI